MKRSDPVLKQYYEQHRALVMKSALADGMFTDRSRDGVCEELCSEGWLERAAPIASRPHVNRGPAYLPTEKAELSWFADPTA